jgi:polyisoprenoid-binding protein YceI
MQNLKLIFIIFLAISSTLATAQTKKIDPSKTNIEWVAKKIMDEYRGSIKLKQGRLIFKKSKLKSGSFVVDMNSIIATDQQGRYIGFLNGHLKSEDFFSTDKYKTSNMVFKRIADNGNGKYSITADLTIRDITQPVNFDVLITGNTATANIKIDRTKYGIVYGSGSFFENLGDKLIEDIFQLNVKLHF